MQSIYRDSFARGNVVKERVYVGGDRSISGDGCAECGSVKRTPTGRPFLYRYGWSDDQGTRSSSMQTKLFCSRSCERAYNGGR